MFSQNKLFLRMSKVWLFLWMFKVVSPVDIDNDFKNKLEFESRDQKHQWIRMGSLNIYFM